MESFAFRDTFLEKSQQPADVQRWNPMIGNLNLELRMVKLSAIDGSMNSTVWLRRRSLRVGRTKL
jgi:hypothetical protein